MTSRKTLASGGDLAAAQDIDLDLLDRTSTPVDREVSEAIDSVLGVSLISIRMPNSMIDLYRGLAAKRGIAGYQTLMKEVLQDHLDQYAAQLLKRHLTLEPQHPARRPAPVVKAKVAVKATKRKPVGKVLAPAKAVAKISKKPVLKSSIAKSPRRAAVPAAV